MTDISKERLLNTRAWAAARVGQLSGAEVIVGAIDEVLRLREQVRVPREPTSKLLAAMCNCQTGTKVLQLDGEEAAELYAALIAAAQDEGHE